MKLQLAHFLKKITLMQWFKIVLWLIVITITSHVAYKTHEAIAIAFAYEHSWIHAAWIFCRTLVVDLLKLVFILLCLGVCLFLYIMGSDIWRYILIKFRK
jgi:hypothetical protein